MNLIAPRWCEFAISGHDQHPFNLKITNILAMEPHRLIRLCDILKKAVKELERKSEEGEDQFR